MLDEFEETKFPTHLNLKFFSGESTTCIFWHMKEYFRLIKSGKKKTRERKKRLKLQTRRGHSTFDSIRVLCEDHKEDLCSLSSAFTCAKWSLSRAQPNEVNTLYAPRLDSTCCPLCRILCLWFNLLQGTSISRRASQRGNGSRIRWRLAPRVVGIPKFRAFILFPFVAKKFLKLVLSPPAIFARFCAIP